MNFAMPPLAGGYAYREVNAAAQGRPVNRLSRHGEPRSLKQAVLANVAGIRIQPVDVEKDRRRRIEEITYDIRDIHPAVHADMYQRAAAGTLPEGFWRLCRFAQFDATKPLACAQSTDGTDRPSRREKHR